MEVYADLVRDAIFFLLCFFRLETLCLSVAPMFFFSTNRIFFLNSVNNRLIWKCFLFKHKYLEYQLSQILFITPSSKPTVLVGTRCSF